MRVYVNGNSADICECDVHLMCIQIVKLCNPVKRHTRFR